MMNIVSLNWMHVLDSTMHMFMAVFRRRDHHNTCQRNPKRDRDASGGLLTHEWPCSERSDERRECEYHLAACSTY